MQLRHATQRDRLIAGLCAEGLCYSQADVEARRLERAARSAEDHERRSARAQISLLARRAAQPFVSRRGAAPEGMETA